MSEKTISGETGISAEIVDAASEATLTAVAADDHELTASLLEQLINRVPKAFQANEATLVEIADFLGDTMADEDIVAHIEREHAITVESTALLSDDMADIMRDSGRVMSAREVSMADDRFDDTLVVALRGPDHDVFEVTREFAETNHEDNNFKGVIGNSGGEVVISVWDEAIKPSVGDAVVVGKALATQVGGTAQLKINASSVVQCYDSSEAPPINTSGATAVDATGVVPDSFDALDQSGVRTVDSASENNAVVDDPSECDGPAVDIAYLRVPVRFDTGVDSHDYTETVVLKKKSLAKVTGIDEGDMQTRVQGGFGDLVARKAADILQGERLHIEGTSLGSITVDTVERVPDEQVVPLFE